MGQGLRLFLDLRTMDMGMVRIRANFSTDITKEIMVLGKNAYPEFRNADRLSTGAANAVYSSGILHSHPAIGYLLAVRQ